MTAPSPICTVKDGSGSAQATTNGVDVTPTNTVTIALATTAGADVWTLTCIGTDETSVAATVTSGLTINQTTKTATFTAPAAGKAYLFRSTVRSSGSSDSYSATFKVCTLTSDSKRVAALGETTENSSTNGWVEIVNAGVRNGAVSSSIPVLYSVNLTTEQMNISWGTDGELAAYDGTIDFNYESTTRPDTREIVVAFNSASAPHLTDIVNPQSGCILTLVDGDGAAGTHAIAFTATAAAIKAGDTVQIDVAWGWVRMIYDGDEARWHVLGSSGVTFA